MPKCRENRRLRLKRRKRYDARLKRLSDRPLLPFVDMAKAVLHDLGRPGYVDVARDVAKNPVIEHLLNRKNVEITEDHDATPCHSHVTSIYKQNEEWRQAADVVEDIRDQRNRSLLRLATIIEAEWHHWSEGAIRLEETRFIIRRYCWLIEEVGQDLGYQIEVTLSCRYGFRRMTKAEPEKRRDQAG